MLKRILTFCWQNRLFTVLVVLIGTMVVGTATRLMAGADEMYTDAVSRYGGDRVIALTRLVDDPANSFKKRNTAIGMLANLSDVRALPVLEKYWTGSDNAVCDNGRSRLCQYELMKAVRNSKENSGPDIITRILQ